MTSWIYQLTKAQIVEHLAAQHVDTGGTFEEVRQRLVQLVRQNPELFTKNGTESRESKTGENHRDTMDEASPRMEASRDAASFVETPMLETAKIMNQIRKWGCHFDGRDPHAFLERVEELNQAYGYPDEYLLRGLPEMLRGEALTWYRNYREGWHTWGEFRRDFKKEYLPREYLARMRREARARIQREGEPFHTYSNDLLQLTRRAGGWTTGEQLDLLYENMEPQYKRYIRLRDIRSIAELRAEAAEVEQTEKQISDRKKSSPNLRDPRPPPTSTNIYNKDECCWRCKQRGHTRSNCRRPPRKFCSQCGRDGVLTRECHPLPGNDRRAEIAAKSRP